LYHSLSDDYKLVGYTIATGEEMWMIEKAQVALFSTLET
jgi:hypothetical protein